MAAETWLVVLGTLPCVAAALFAVQCYRRSSAASEPSYLDDLHRTFLRAQTRPFARWDDDAETDDNPPA